MLRGALYGCKAAGRDFRNHLQSCIAHLAFIPYLVDPSFWIVLSIKSDENEHCECAIFHANDYLVVSENADSKLRN